MEIPFNFDHARKNLENKENMPDRDFEGAFVMSEENPEPLLDIFDSMLFANAPLPEHVSLNFTIERSSSLKNLINPEYHLYLC